MGRVRGARGRRSRALGRTPPGAAPPEPVGTAGASRQRPGAVVPGVAQLSLSATWFWYLIAGTTYVAASVWHKWLLNWVAGPLWLVVVVWFGPLLVEKVHRRR